MGRIYTVPLAFTYTAAGGDFDLCYIAPADDKPCKLRGFIVGQTSEVGDAQEEGVRITVARITGTITASSGGSAVTPVPVDSADAAAGFTARAGDSTVATQTGGAVTSLWEYGWNERVTPFEIWYPEERMCPKAKQGEALVIRAQTTLADDMSATITAVVEEE